MIGKLLGRIVAEVFTLPVTAPLEAVKQGEKLVDNAFEEEK